ncbi:MAG: hypothetical protein WCQ16_07195 [Verrucomicrobiae bacterium]
MRELLLAAFLGAILAGVVQMAREPDRIPPCCAANASVAGEMLAALRELASSKRPISWTINQTAVNEFLATTIRMKPSDSTWSGPGAKFQRAFVRMDTGRLALGVEQQFLGRRLYFFLDVIPEPSPQGMGAKVVGGTIGRLPVPPVLLPAFLRLFEPTISGLSQPLALIRQAKSVTVNPVDATLQWAGPP